MRACQVCGRELVQRPREGNQRFLERKSCDAACRQAAATVKARENATERKRKRMPAPLPAHRACLVCGEELVRKPGETSTERAVRRSCGGTCTPVLQAWARGAKRANLGLEEFVARRREQQAAEPAATTTEPVPPGPDTRSELQRWRDRWVVELMRPDPDAATRLYRMGATT